MSQYPLGMTRDPATMPLEIVDPDGDTWLWTDADKRGVAGYQFAGGTTMARSAFGIGPAHARDYVVGGHYKVADGETVT